MKNLFAALSLIFISACGANHRMVMDPSIQAITAGDYTLAMSVCLSVPGQGVDSCRVKAGTPITAIWSIVIPLTGVSGGEIDVQYNDITKTYPITSNTVNIPLVDIIGHTTWESTDSGTAVAFANVIYKDNSGATAFMKARGFAFIIVTDSNYDPMPLDSGFQAFSTDCKIQYSTSGRSAINCK